MGKESNQNAADKEREKADLWKKMTDENAARAEREWQREEEAANRAARELQEKKKKKRRKIRIAVLIILVVAGAGIFGGVRYQQYQKEKASQEADVLALAEGEELVYGKITKAVGNDITVTVLDVKTDTAAEEGTVDQSGAPVGAGDQGNMQGAAPQGMNGQSGGAPGGNGQGSAPEGTSQDAGIQNAADNQGTADVHGGQNQSGQTQSAAHQNALQYTETSQTKEYEVPVGTAVTTRLGATTSFSRLSAGNIVGIVVQSGTDNILRIKIVE